jgi:16S rRNA (cytidine1402-2'-O)-methyltransferase
MPTGTLFVVATPIGNLEDMTLRAIRILREVDIIAAEDTRRTSRLLHHYGIKTPTISLHAHNEARRSQELLGRLRAGQSVAIVSDAGTPVISDPGLQLVQTARAAGIPVTAVPGASAIPTILSAAGVPADQFHFAGFVPRRSSDRIRWLTAFVAGAMQPIVVFEAPHRLGHFLSDALSILGDRPIVVGRELTKAHEEIVISPISAAMTRFRLPRGEFTIVILPAEQPGLQETAVPDAAAIRAEVGELTSSGKMTMRQASSVVAGRYGLRTNDVYRIVRP